MLIEAARSSLLIVDVQENLGPVMAEPRQVYRHCGLLLRGAATLGVPVTVTEQYPRGLGPTMGELVQLLPEGTPRMEKVHFAATAEAEILDRMRGLGRNQVVVAGIEAHICVTQTVLGLAAAGFTPFVVADACSSRVQANHQLAMERLRGAGIGVVSTEMVLFEWMARAGTPQFKEVSALIK